MASGARCVRATPSSGRSQIAGPALSWLLRLPARGATGVVDRSWLPKVADVEGVMVTGTSPAETSPGVGSDHRVRMRRPQRPRPRCRGVRERDGGIDRGHRRAPAATV
jgi:hypothetical protein